MGGIWKDDNVFHNERDGLGKQPTFYEVAT